MYEENKNRIQETFSGNSSRCASVTVTKCPDKKSLTGEKKSFQFTTASLQGKSQQTEHEIARSITATDKPEGGGMYIYFASLVNIYTIA